MGDRAWRGWGLSGALVMVLAGGCGDAGGEVALSNTAASATSTTIAPVTVASPTPASTMSSVAGPAAGVFEGVVVAIGQTMIEPYPRWWVIDLADEAVIEGSSRVLVEVANDDVGCGDVFHRMFAHQIDAGEAVSFELVAGEPGPRPDFWMTEGDETFDAAPAVRGQRLRAVCPEGTDAAAAQLAAQRAMWDERGPDSYEFSMTWHIFNSSYGDYRIGVAHGAAVSIVKDGATRLNPAGVESSSDAGLPLTIDELFDELERQVSGDSFVASYDPQLGFPVSVEVDQMLNAVDDELEVRVADLVVGVPAAVVDRPPSIGQRVEATLFHSRRRVTRRGVVLARRRRGRRHHDRRVVTTERADTRRRGALRRRAPPDRHTRDRCGKARPRCRSRSPRSMPTHLPTPAPHSRRAGPR